VLAAGHVLLEDGEAATEAAGDDAAESTIAFTCVNAARIRAC
jgi:hypothetical protein